MIRQSKSVIQDIAPSRKRSVTRPVKRYAEHNQKSDIKSKRNTFSGVKAKEVPIYTRKKKKNGKKLSFLIAVISVSILLYYAVSALSSMSIEVKLVERIFTLSEPIEISLPYDVVTNSDAVRREFVSSEKSSIDKKASGQIQIFNAFDSNSQTLVEKTRFESPDGRIYRISERIVVPGAEEKDGKLIPSSIKATVYADDYGEEYNISDLVNFKIPGFKGTKRYTAFYANSVTPLSGGVKGEKSIVGKTQSNEALESVTDELVRTLKAKSEESLNSDLLLIGGRESIEIDSSEIFPQVGSLAEKFTVSIRGKSKMIAVKKTDLERELEKILFENFPSELNYITLNDYETLSMASSFKFGDEKAKIQMSGDIIVTWHPREEQISDKIYNSRGQDVAEIFDSIFNEFESVDSAEAVFSPSWWRKVPKNKDKIYISYIK